MKNLKNRLKYVFLGSAILLAVCAAVIPFYNAQAAGGVPTSNAAFTAGNVVVFRAGSGTGSLINTGNPIFLDEFTPAGALVQSIPLPVTASGANLPCVTSGTATSEGFLTRSTDGQYIVLSCYGSPIPASTSLPGTASATVPRVVARIDAAGNVDTTTALTDYSTGNNPRSAASTNGTDFWVSGGAGGVRYATFGATTSTQVSTTLTNIRGTAIFDGQLFISTASGTAIRIGAVGSGTPTTAGQTITNIPGFPTGGSPYAFFFADLSAAVPGVDTLYVADDTSATGGIQKYSLVGGNWTATGIAGTGADAYRGITGFVNGTTVTLYTTRKGTATATGGGELASLDDTTGYNGTLSATPTLLATAGANTTFRGVALAPTGGNATPTPTPTVTPTITPTPTPTITPTPTPTPGSDLTITQSAPTSVAVGGTLNYTLVVTNTGTTLNGRAFDAGFLLPIAGYTNVTVVSSGCFASSSINGNSVNLIGCSTLGANASSTITVAVTPNGTGTLTSSTATVDSGNAINETNESNNTAAGVSTTVNAAPTNVVVNEVYGGGSNTGATYNADYIELYNRGTTPADLGGYSLQYASATGMFTSVIVLPSTSIAPGGFYLVQTQPSGTIGGALTPNFTSSANINLSATNGNVLLAAGTASVGACPTPGAANVVDRVGYGTGTCFEGTAAAPAASNTTSVQRVPNGSDTNNNSADFIVTAGTPGTANVSPNTAPTITSAANTTFMQNVAGNFQVTATGNPASTFSTTGPLPTGVTLSSAGLLSGTPTQSGTFTFTITATNGTAPDATQTFTLTVTPAQPVTLQRPNVDFDGDGKSDYVVNRNVSDGANSTNPSKYWYVDTTGTNNFLAARFGIDTDVSVPADYDGDRKADFAVWRRNGSQEATFFILQSMTNTVRTENFGQAGDIPNVTADYDGDGKADLAVYRAGTSAGQQGYFYYRGSLNNPSGGINYIPWGGGPDARPFVGDFDGDGRADFCVNTPNGGRQQFILMRSSDLGVEYISWGLASDQLVSGDFDADGKSDFCVVRTVNNQRVWYILTRTGAGSAIGWGLPDDQLAPGDYDGDGKVDVGVWRGGSNGIFYVLRSSDTGLQTYNWGLPTDTATAAWTTRP